MAVITIAVLNEIKSILDDMLPPLRPEQVDAKTYLLDIITPFLNNKEMPSEASLAELATGFARFFRVRGIVVATTQETSIDKISNLLIAHQMLPDDASSPEEKIMLGMLKEIVSNTSRVKPLISNKSAPASLSWTERLRGKLPAQSDSSEMAQEMEAPVVVPNYYQLTDYRRSSLENLYELTAKDPTKSYLDDGISLIYAAIKYGFDSFLKTLLSSKNSSRVLGCKYDKWKSPLQFALDETKISAIKILLAILDKEDALKVQYWAVNNLQSAIIVSMIETEKIDYSLMIYRKLNDFQGGGEDAQMENILHVSVRNDWIDVLSAVKENIPAVNAVSNYKYSPAQYAIHLKKFAAVKILLKKGAYNVNVWSESGTLLHMAVKSSWAEGVKRLVDEENMSIFARDNYNCSLLILLCNKSCLVQYTENQLNENNQILKFLLGHPNMTAEELNDNDSFALRCALESERIDIIVLLVSDPRVDVSGYYQGMTLTHYANHKRWPKVTEALRGRNEVFSPVAFRALVDKSKFLEEKVMTQENELQALKKMQAVLFERLAALGRSVPSVEQHSASTNAPLTYLNPTTATVGTQTDASHTPSPVQGGPG